MSWREAWHGCEDERRREYQIQEAKRQRREWLRAVEEEWLALPYSMETYRLVERLLTGRTHT